MKVYTIDQILRVAFQAAKAELLRGRKFVDPDLQQLFQEGRIIFKPLGAVVQALDGTDHQVQQVSAPLVWSKADEQKNRTEDSRIRFVRNLITNGFDAHDAVVSAYIGENGLVFSPTYHYDLGNTNYLSGGGALDFVANLYSAFCPIPLEHFGRKSMPVAELLQTFKHHQLRISK